MAGVVNDQKSMWSIKNQAFGDSKFQLTLRLYSFGIVKLNNSGIEFESVQEQLFQFFKLK